MTYDLVLAQSSTAFEQIRLSNFTYKVDSLYPYWFAPASSFQANIIVVGCTEDMLTLSECISLHTHTTNLLRDRKYPVPQDWRISKSARCGCLEKGYAGQVNIIKDQNTRKVT